MRTKYSKFYQDVNADTIAPLKRSIKAIVGKLGLGAFDADPNPTVPEDDAVPYTSRAGSPYIIPGPVAKLHGSNLGTNIATLDKLKSDLMGSGSAPSKLKEVPTILNHWAGSYYAPSIGPGGEHFSMDPADSVVNTHEIGHYLDFTGKPGKSLVSALQTAFLPGFGHLRTLWDERQANKKSWKALKKTYGDDKELLDKFKQLRSKALTRAFSTYLTNSGIRAATSFGAGGAAAAYAHHRNKVEEEGYNKLRKEYEELVNSEEFKSLSKKEQRKILRDPRWKKYKKRGFMGKRMRELGYGTLGLIAGDYAGLLPASIANQYAGKKLFSYMSSDERNRGLDELNKMIQNYNPSSGSSSRASRSSARGSAFSSSRILPNLLAAVGGFSDDIEDKPKTSILDSLKGYWNNRKNNTGSSNKKNK